MSLDLQRNHLYYRLAVTGAAALLAAPLLYSTTAQAQTSGMRPPPPVQVQGHPLYNPQVPATFKAALATIAHDTDMNTKFMSAIEAQDVDGVRTMLIDNGAGKKFMASRLIDLSGPSLTLRAMPDNLIALTVIHDSDGTPHGLIQFRIFSWADYVAWVNGSFDEFY